MAGALATVDRVHRALAVLDSSEEGDAAWLAEAMRRWLMGAALDEALGLAGGWRDVLRQREQRRALAIVRATLPPMSCRSAADEIARRLRAYEHRGTWRDDHLRGRRPGGAQGPLYDYLVTDGPRSADRIRRLLGGYAAAAVVPHAPL